MPSTKPEVDLQRAKSLREQAKGVKDTTARQRFIDAADRLERRAGQKLAKVGRPPRKRKATTLGGLR